MNTLQNIKCPTCDKQGTWIPENLFRPFCSDRCKLIDLGEWASESRKIPGEDADPNLLPNDSDNANDSKD